jgi:orotidine-5'-phosphate decarboxylase
LGEGATPAHTMIFVAIDTPDLDRAVHLARAVGPVTGALKVGLELWAAHGPRGVEAVRAACPGTALFLDLKLHDIPNTVAGAVRALAPLAPRYLTLHASGGAAMVRAAAQVAPAGTTLLAVTVLTSLDATSLESVGQGADSEAQALRLARLAQRAGAGGAVCSAREARSLRTALGPDATLMVPGIRPAGANAGDQARTATPREALDAGATHLVVGRPITGAPDPADAANAILASIPSEQ